MDLSSLVSIAKGTLVLGRDVTIGNRSMIKLLQIHLMSAYQRGPPDLISLLVGSEQSPAKSTQDVFLMILLAHKLILDAPSCEVGTLVKSNPYDYMAITLSYISFDL